ncbi:uncharacterized protein LOC103095440 isoform X5 [Monodelphis domestica]|uniref:uncharacterized protein LOC103095440 isoform X5 n=1 Tax=Monodelphis domestica TaxID=13616 RepID=UPI0007B41D8F|nr:uncharacterized protein LOC103095440 isoform X5 [Monodelphis domestica]
MKMHLAGILELKNFQFCLLLSSSTGLKTTENDYDSVFTDEEDEKSCNDLLVLLPTKSWGPSSSVKSKLPEPDKEHEDSREGTESTPEKRKSFCPPCYAWQPLFFLQPLGFSAMEMGPKALTGTGLMVNGLHYETCPNLKKASSKTKPLKTGKMNPKPRDQPSGMDQLLEMFEKNKQRIAELSDFMEQKPTLSIFLNQRNSGLNRHPPMFLPQEKNHQPVRKKTPVSKERPLPKYEVWSNSSPLKRPCFQSPNFFHPKTPLLDKHHLQSFYPEPRPWTPRCTCTPLSTRGR